MSIRAALAVFIVAAAMAPSPLAQPKRIAIQQPFDYPSLGAGPQLRNVLIFRPGEEDDTASLVIVTALQRLQHSLVEAPKSLAQPLAPNRDYSVEIAPLSDEDVRTHNEKYPQLRVPPAAIYGVSYNIRYAIEKAEKNRRLLVLVTPTLHHRGVASKWRKYDRDYSSDFLASRLVQAISNEFAEALRAQQAG